MMVLGLAFRERHAVAYFMALFVVHAALRYFGRWCMFGRFKLDFLVFLVGFGLKVQRWVAVVHIGRFNFF